MEFVEQITCIPGMYNALITILHIHLRHQHHHDLIKSIINLALWSWRIHHPRPRSSLDLIHDEGSRRSPGDRWRYFRRNEAPTFKYDMGRNKEDGASEFGLSESECPVSLVARAVLFGQIFFLSSWGSLVPRRIHRKLSSDQDETKMETIYLRFDLLRPNLSQETLTSIIQW